MSHPANTQFLENLHELAEEFIKQERWSEFGELREEAKRFGIDLYLEYFELIYEHQSTLSRLKKEVA